MSAHPTRAAAALGSSGQLGPREQTGSAPGAPAFRTLIDLDRTHLEIENEKIALSPGMAVEAAIVLGRRRIIEYVLHPLKGISPGRVQREIALARGERP